MFGQLKLKTNSERQINEIFFEDLLNQNPNLAAAEICRTVKDMASHRLYTLWQKGKMKIMI